MFTDASVLAPDRLAVVLLALPALPALCPACSGVEQLRYLLYEGSFCNDLLVLGLLADDSRVGQRFEDVKVTDRCCKVDPSLLVWRMVLES